MPQPGALSPGSFVRPWADSPPPRSESCSSDQRDDADDDVDDEEISVDDEPKVVPKGNSVSPLDALLQMTSKTFDGQDSQNSGGDGKFVFQICTAMCYIILGIFLL